MSSPLPPAEPVGNCIECGRAMYSTLAPRGYPRHKARGMCGKCYIRKARGDALDSEDVERRRVESLTITVEARREHLQALIPAAPIEARWEDRAACLSIGAHVFETHELRDEARSICNNRCPVARSCLEAAMNEEAGDPSSYRNGIRGGLSPRERTGLDQLRRDRQEPAA